MKRLMFWFLGMGLSLLSLAQPGAEEQLAGKYFQEEEYESALELYEKLQRRTPTEALTLRVVECYERLDRFDEAIRFIDKAQRDPGASVLLPVVRAELQEKMGDVKSADKAIETAIDQRLRTQGDFIKVGSYLYQKQKLGWAAQVYLASRKTLKDPFAFSNELGFIYAEQGDYAASTLEFLNDYYNNPANLGTANLQILNLVSPNSQAAVEKTLLAEVDKRQSDPGLRTILYEFYVLTTNFVEAFTQVKSIDRLFREDGERVYQFALTMRNNKRYDLSNKAFDYLLERSRNSPYFYQAHFQKATNDELRAFEQVPVDLAAIRSAVDNYNNLLTEFGRRPLYFDAIYRRSRLMVFYLNDLDGALKEISEMVNQRPLLKPEEWAQAALLQGDILLMKQDYNQAKLQYTQVSNEFQDRQTGAMARYKLAQLEYYKGEFQLATALLSAIKDNTSNDISNDAIRLNLIILDNTGVDTNQAPLKAFARAQLLAYQRQFPAALALLDSITAAYPTHALADEILWERASIFLTQNDLPTAERYLDELLTTHGEGIYGDDALYTKARIYDFTLKDKDTALKQYLNFLTRFPGSLYSVEVRKRIRELRAATN
jgi:tetratricopeptide (TPR) repeat protein